MDERPIRTRPDTKKIKSSPRAVSRPVRERGGEGTEIPLGIFPDRISEPPGETLPRSVLVSKHTLPFCSFVRLFFFFFNLLTEHTSRVLLERVLQLLCVYPGRFPRGLETKPQ